jgi:hypothetical protein
VRDIERDARVTLLVQRWSEDWSALGWLRVDGEAELVAAAGPAVVGALRAKYPQYAGHDLEGRPMLAIAIGAVTAWAASPGQADAARRTVE